MTRRSWRSGSWMALVAVLVATPAGACRREPPFLTRTFEPGQHTEATPALAAELTELSYGRAVLRATLKLTNRTRHTVRVDGARATVELEDLHYASLGAETLTIPPGSSAALVVEVNLGRRLHVPATLVLHGLTVGATPGDRVALELPPAPHPGHNQSGTGP